MSIRKKIKKAKSWGAGSPWRPNGYELMEAEYMGAIRRAVWLWSPWAIAVRVRGFIAEVRYANSEGAERPW